jgi:hypothetical protein
LSKRLENMGPKSIKDLGFEYTTLIRYCSLVLPLFVPPLLASIAQPNMIPIKYSKGQLTVVVCGAMLLMNVIDDGTSKLDFIESTG